jgi:hypothetical protein
MARGNFTRGPEASKYKHGMCTTKVYAVWRAMKARCQRPSAQGYANYGGRGIRVCERWQEFDGFYADMGDCPPGLSLERINNDGNYEPSNCKWAAKHEQTANRRNIKCSYEMADEIRALYANGMIKNHIAKKFGMSHGNISFIVENKRWVRPDEWSVAA